MCGTKNGRKQETGSDLKSALASNSLRRKWERRLFLIVRRPAAVGRCTRHAPLPRAHLPLVTWSACWNSTFSTCHTPMTIVSPHTFVRCQSRWGHCMLCVCCSCYCSKRNSQNRILKNNCLPTFGNELKYHEVCLFECLKEHASF